MNDVAARPFFSLPTLPKADAEDLHRAVTALRRRTGIVLGEHKIDMAGRTLGLHAHRAGMSSVREYLTMIEQNVDSPEWQALISAFTVNHTAFFREKYHFDILAEFCETRKKKPISVWCCASSTGEEPYSIAITMYEACGRTNAGMSVLASDIDTQALERARKGVYTMERARPVRPELLRRYFLRGAGGQAGMVMVKPFIREMVTFEAVNLVDPVWPIKQKFDVIFCRNTMIYFDKPTQTRILQRFVPLLKPDGLLFAGHSENFTYLTDAFRLRGQTVYTVA